MQNITTGNNMYAIQDVPGKGKGLVAIEKISKGTRILCEEPIIITPQNESDNEQLRLSICKQVDALSKYQRQAFLSMHNIHPYRNIAEQYLGIFRTNGLPIETDGIGEGIFLEACRINHACDNNAQKKWNENIKQHTVHALRDIDKGEEITIYYLGINKSRKARNDALQAKFGFTCSCRLCSLPLEQSQESDQRLEKIYRLETLIGQDGLYGIVSSPLRILRYVDQQVHLYKEQGPDNSGLSRAFFDAAQIAIANGDLARGRIFAERAISVWQTSGGSDCKEVVQYGYLTHDPSKFEMYGMTMKWKTAVDEVPSGLEPKDYEDWLWKRDKPQQPGQPVNLRNHVTFPAFMDLPGEKVIDLDFDESCDKPGSRPRRHWCFLAEIVSVTQLPRLQMEIRDVDGETVPLFFYTERRGDELAPKQVKRGYTVAILYARRHAFQFDKPCIRHDDPRMIKIFPVSLHDLLALNDQVQQFSTEFDGLRICHGCGKKRISLQRCAKCLYFWYCDKNCQTAGWNEERHKANCKLLRDSDLRGLFDLQWDDFDNHIQFPLHVAKKSKRGKEDEGETLVQRVHRLSVSDDTLAANKADSSADLFASASSKVKEGQRIAASTDEEVVEPAGKPYAIRVIAGKGKGLVATRRITKGTRLLSEMPLFRVPRNNPDFKAVERIVENEVNGLDADQRRTFLDLANIYEKDHSLSFGIARTNVLPLGSNATSGGLFLEASRINHSCRHNAQNIWNENIGQLTIHALRDIEEGQEITITYLASTSEYAERQRFLKEKFKFECKCELCSLPPAQRKQSDARLESLQAIDQLVGTFFWGDIEPKTALHLLHTMFALFDEEGIWDASIARAYKDAYDIATEIDDEPRARVFAERVYDARRLIEGDDSPNTVQLKQRFEKLSAQTPQGMNQAQFENWLWMLDKASAS